MLGSFSLSLGSLGLAWWIAYKITQRRQPRAKLIPRGRPLSVGKPGELSVVSYNLLANNLVVANTAYNYANALYMSWEYRWCRIQEEIAGFAADLLCLQEVEIERWEELYAFMQSLGYDGVKQAPKKSNMTITNAIFFKQGRFKVSWEEHRSRAMALELHYEGLDGNDKVIYVVNWHLEGHPGKPGERIAQMKSILQRLATRQGAEAGHCDVIIAGDFNATRWNSPWNLLYRGILEAYTTEPNLPNVNVTTQTVAHPYALQDVYQAANRIPEFTTRAPNRRSEVDFIWCSRHMKVEAVMRPANPHHLSLIDKIYLPNRLFPSDHLPIGAVVTC